MEYCSLKDLGERVSIYCRYKGIINGSMKFLGVTTLLERGEELEFQYTFFRGKRAKKVVIYDFDDEDLERDKSDPIRKGISLLEGSLNCRLKVSRLDNKTSSSRLRIEYVPLAIENGKTIVEELDRVHTP